MRSNTLTTQIVVRQTPKLKDKREAYTNRCSRTLLPKWSIMISFRRSLPRLVVSIPRKRTPNICPRANIPPSVTSPHHTCPRKLPILRPKLTPQKLKKLSPQLKLVSISPFSFYLIPAKSIQNTISFFEWTILAVTFLVFKFVEFKCLTCCVSLII